MTEQQRSLLLYSGWPLGYHNLEAERKAIGFAEAGYDVVYNPRGIGIRNPRPSSIGKAAWMVADRARRLTVHSQPDRSHEARPFRTATFLVIPPRQLRPVERLNVGWLEHQLLGVIDQWDRAVAWIRWPSPEIVAALPRLRPASIVYECVDAYWHTPGISGRWKERFEAAEKRLATIADAIIVPSEPLARRLRQWGSSVSVVPHGVDVFPWEGWRPPGAHGGPITVGFVGTLDYKLDIPVLRHIAAHHPDWRIRLIGPIQEGFDPAWLGDLSNVTVEAPIPPRELADMLYSFDLGIMPYFDEPVYEYSTPLKNLEYMAAGKPAVARPTAALEPYSDYLYFARTPEEFSRQLERALSEDSPERAQCRRAVAEASSWQHTIERMLTIVQKSLDA